MKLYIYLLYETFILNTNYILKSVSLICSFGVITLYYNWIVEATYMECVLFIVLTMLILSLIVTILLFPYVLYIPGDDSYLDKILSNSNTPQAKCLVEAKSKNIKK